MPRAHPEVHPLAPANQFQAICNLQEVQGPAKDLGPQEPERGRKRKDDAGDHLLETIF